MPKRFYFDVNSGQETIRDNEGIEADDLEQALSNARSVLSEMADDLAAADISSPWTLVVRDETGLSVAHIPIGIFFNSGRQARNR
jgi:hypothetical protein